jgi:integrase
MPQIKANALVIKAKLKERGNHTIQGHPNLVLASRGDGTGSWRIKYHAPGGGRRWHTVSNDAKNAPFDSVIEAKNKFLVELKHEKVDPKDRMQAEAEAKAVKAAADSRVLCITFEEWMQHTGKRRRRALAPRTAEEYRRLYRLHIEKALGKKPLATISKADVATVVENARKASADIEKGQRGLQGNKVLTLLSSIFEWAVDREFIDRNPCRGLEPPVPKDNPDGKGVRPLTNEELRILWKEADQHMKPALVRVLKLTLLLGRRISEVAGAARHEARVDHDPPLLFIPASREGNKAKQDDAVPLPPMALALIRDALAVGGQNDPLFVGASDRGTVSHAFMEFRRNKEWEGRTRLHDARTLINDQMAMMQIPSEMRSRTLHHTGDLRALVNTTYSAYDHLPERLRALRLWELRLRMIVSGRKLHTIRWRS